MAYSITEAISMLQYQTTVLEMRSFLGLCNVYHRLVCNFLRLEAPRNKKLKKGAPQQFKLEDTKGNEMDALKEKLLKPPVLALSQLNELYAISTGACGS